MDLRLVKPLQFESVGAFCVQPSFSGFRYRERFPSCVPLARIFAQARQLEYETLIDEKIPCEGFAKEEDTEFREHYNKLFEGSQLRRLSFFKKSLVNIRRGYIQGKDVQELERQISEWNHEDFLGYAILKGNKFSDNENVQWVIFESVMRPSTKSNSFNHTTKCFEVTVCSRRFNVEGSLYCQQNSKTNCCGHAALRSVIASTQVGDISSTKINEILSAMSNPFKWDDEEKELNGEQIHMVLNNVLAGVGLASTYFQIKNTISTFFAFENVVGDNNVDRERTQSLLYSCVEAGYPAILYFKWKKDNEIQKAGHVISILGHTFNEDAWVPRAVRNYFSIGRDTRYVPSKEWVSAYICHDDIFGSNYCVPKRYITHNSDVTDVAVFCILPKGILDPIEAEGLAAEVLYTIVPGVPDEKSNCWINRLRMTIQKKSF